MVQKVGSMGSGLCDGTGFARGEPRGSGLVLSVG